MASNILLRKVGGGYIFIHRMLLEYFANLDELDGTTEVVTDENYPRRLADGTDTDAQLMQSDSTNTQYQQRQ